MSATDVDTTELRRTHEHDAPSPSLARSMARGATASTSLGLVIGLLLAAVGVLDAAWAVGILAASAALAGMGLGALGHALMEDAAGSVDPRSTTHDR